MNAGVLTVLVMTFCHPTPARAPRQGIPLSQRNKTMLIYLAKAPSVKPLGRCSRRSICCKHVSKKSETMLTAFLTGTLGLKARPDSSQTKIQLTRRSVTSYCRIGSE